MSTSFHLRSSRTRTRDLSPITTPHRRSRNIISLSDSDDDNADDYPYSLSHRPSRALTIRPQPGQLERHNIWSDRHRSSDREEEREYEHEHERERMYRHTTTHVDRPERVRCFSSATITRPAHHHHHHDHEHVSAHHWPGDMFRRKEKLVDEGWETRERSRSRDAGWRDSFWGDGGFWGDRESGRESEDERVTRYRKIKKTRTEEWRPLTGWRKV